MAGHDRIATVAAIDGKGVLVFLFIGVATLIKQAGTDWFVKNARPWPEKPKATRPVIGETLAEDDDDGSVK